MMQRVAGFSITPIYSSFVRSNRRMPKRHSFHEVKDSCLQFLGSTTSSSNQGIPTYNGNEGGTDGALNGTGTLEKFSSFDSASNPGLHNVNGIMCREVDIDVDKVGTVTVLEATAESQDDLVNSALLMDGDDEVRNEGPTLNSGDPYGAVLWPAASATANYIMERNYISSNMSILELGAGTGLVSLAAALAGASQIMATDYEQIPLDLLQYASKHTNNNNQHHSYTIQPKDQQKRKEQLAKIQTCMSRSCC